VAVENPIVTRVRVAVYHSTATHTLGIFFSRSWVHSSMRSEKPSLSESVSASPPPHGTETDLLENSRHSSSQSGTPWLSLSVSVSTSTQPHLPARVFACSWGYASPQSATSLLSEFIFTSPQPHFSATKQTRNRHLNSR
jgi:hypothetical protein